MNRFWDPVLRDVVEAVKPRCLIEVGIDTGLLTAKLLDYCATSDAILHAIDPQPRINAEEWQDRHGQRVVFHLARSLDVLSDIHGADVALIDGDHNWFTVYHELKALEETALTDGSVPPLIALHDVGWPYGRRDMYYDPDSIPEPHRHPYRKLGLLPGESEPAAGGVNWELNNAISEDLSHSGVRTAAEDFMSDSQLEWHLFDAHGLNGLGIVVTKDRLLGNDSLREVLESLRAPRFLDMWTRELELARIQAEIEANRRISEVLEDERQLRSRLDERLAQTDRLQELLVDAERRLSDVPDLQLRIAELERELSNARDQAVALNQRLTMGEQVLADVFSSPSWRLTEPLRSAKQSVRRLRAGRGR